MLVLGEQVVKNPQGGFEVQVYHICRRKTEKPLRVREGAPSPGANTWEMWGAPLMSPTEHSCCPCHSQAAARAPRPPPRGMSHGMARILLHPFQDGPRQVCVVQGLGQPRTRTGDLRPSCGPPGAGQAAAAVLPPQGQDQGVAQEVQAPCLVGRRPVPQGVGHLLLLLTCSLSCDKGLGRAAVHGSQDRNPGWVFYSDC